MPITKIPSHSTLADAQFLQITGPDGVITGYQFDKQQRALYFKESQIIIPSFHGTTHIAEDPVPNATTDLPGLMSADDKAKLDSLLQTRVGVVGFQGGGFPDDGGWINGDLILAAGTEFISLERVGNVVRFTVDSPIPLNCDCESCTQIFLIQDETDVLAIRPPTCGGKLPGVNAYGELKVYLFPESTIADPNNTSATLNNKGNYPSLIFKRYDNAIVPGTASFDLVLKRDSNNKTSTEIGWAFTPGATGVVQNVFFMGKDRDGNQIRFDFEANNDANLLGALLYKGHLISKKMAAIVDYSTTILTTNQYTVREWNIDTATPIGDPIVARNVWQYANPENAVTGTNPKTLILDSSIDLLAIGTLVDLWFVKIGSVGDQAVRRYYFSKRPPINPNHLWPMVGAVQFGDVAICREELAANTGSEDKVAAVQVSAIRDFEKHQWGLTGFDDPLVLFDIASTAGTEAADVSTQHRAIFDTSLPGLRIDPSISAPSNFSERPIYLWHRQNITNGIIRADIGRPSTSDFIPYDFIIRGQVDESSEVYMRVLQTGIVHNSHFIRVSGVHFNDLPPYGTIRAISPTWDQNIVFSYNRKLMFHNANPESDSVVLVSDNVAYTGAVGDVCELLHQEYNTNVVRVEFSFNQTTRLVEVQFKVGMLDMSLPYEEDISGNDIDDYVRGLQAGYAVSSVYSQADTFTGVGTQPSSSPDGFVVYDGGAQIGGLKVEYWNNIEIMIRDNQVWIWWNQLLIPPNPTLSSALPTPVTVSTPYFQIGVYENHPYGKVGARLWPGATVRRMDVRSQITSYNEFVRGQLSIE